jgi:hypothetical protein
MLKVIEVLQPSYNFLSLWIIRRLTYIIRVIISFIVEYGETNIYVV